MLPDERKALEERVRAHDDERLQRMIALEATEWRPEALEIAREELQRRGRPLLTAEAFLQQNPAQAIGESGFCKACEDATDPGGAGSASGTLTRLSLGVHLGPRFIGQDHRCERCGSFEASRWFCVLLPLVPLGQYRVRLRTDMGMYVRDWRRLRRA